MEEIEETPVWSLGRENPVEGMATHSSILEVPLTFPLQPHLPNDKAAIDRDILSGARKLKSE